MGRYWPVLVLLACCVLVVWGVNSIPIILWDESLYSVNAIEMLHSGRWNVHYYDGEIDYYNLKPPFFTQLRALSFRLFGYDYWVHRLPSTCFSIATVLLVYCTGLNLTKNRWWALLAPIFLCIAPAYNTLHVTKGGEYDAMLVFFMLAYCLSFLKALSTNSFKWKLLTIVLMGVAFYTKSIAGWFYVPGMLILVIYYRKHWLVKIQNWYLLGVLLLFPALYFGYLYAAVPGYLEAIYHHHFTRFGSTLNDNPLPWYHYLKSPSVVPYYLPALVLLGWLKFKRITVPAWVLQAQVLVLMFLALISLSATKHGFYTAAIFPVSSLVLASLLRLSVEIISSSIKRKFAVIGVGLLSVFGLHFTFAKAQNYTRYYDRKFPIDYTKMLLRGNLAMSPEALEVNHGEDPRIYYNEARHWFEDSKISSLVVFAQDLHVPNSEGYNPLLMFYVDYWRLEKGMTVDLVTDIGGVKEGDVVLCSEPEKLTELKKYFSLRLIQQSHHCYLFQVKKRNKAVRGIKRLK